MGVPGPAVDGVAAAAVNEVAAAAADGVAAAAVDGVAAAAVDGVAAAAVDGVAAAAADGSGAAAGPDPGSGADGVSMSVPYSLAPDTPALSKVATSRSTRAAACTIGTASAAPDPSPRRMSRSSSGRRPSAVSARRA